MFWVEMVRERRAIVIERNQRGAWSVPTCHTGDEKKEKKP